MYKNISLSYSLIFSDNKATQGVQTIIFPDLRFMRGNFKVKVYWDER
jgi:hypothetical protein